MDTDQFRIRLDAAMEAAPAEPAIAEVVTQAKAGLRQRRLAMGAAATALVVVAGGSAWAIRDHDSSQGVPPVDQVEQGSAQRLLERCQHPDQETDATVALIFGAGTPEVMTSAVSSSRSVATLRSADGAYWAQCEYTDDPDAEFGTWLTVYRTNVEWNPREHVGVGAGNPPYVGPDCSMSLRRGGPRPCETFVAYWNDRRPPEVARAVVTTPDGVSTEAAVNEGYLSFAYVGAMTPELQAEIDDGMPALSGVSVVFYDSDGAELVRNEFDVDYGPGADDEEVDPLEEYPSWAFDVVSGDDADIAQPAP